MDTPKISLLILGASRGLGYLVTKLCLQHPTFTVNILVRDASKIPELTDPIIKSGGKVIQGDLFNPETTVNLTQGIHTVISCISTFGEAELECQTNVLNDALKNGVKRFFASHFGINYEHAPKDNALINGKLEFNRRLLAVQDKILPVIITTGVFYEFFLGLHKEGLNFWGDIDQKIDMIAYDDIASYTVAIALDPERHGQFAFVGAQLSVKEVIDTYNKVRGTNVEAKRVGSIEELKILAEEKKKENPLEGTFLQLFSHIYGGKGLSPKTDNGEFPEVKFTSLEEVLKQKLEITIK